MKKFTDANGRIWFVGINVNQIKKTRAVLDVDLYGLIDEGLEGLSKLIRDPIKLVDVIYVLCMDQAEKEGVSDVQFGEAMWGDAIDNAATAFVQELTDFFPDPRIREGIRSVLEKSQQMATRIYKFGNTQISEVDVERESDKAISKIKRRMKAMEMLDEIRETELLKSITPDSNGKEANGQSGSSPGLSESTPDHSLGTSLT